MLFTPNFNDQTTINNSDVMRVPPEVLVLNCQQKVAIFIGNRYTEFLIGLLIVAYSCIVTIRIAFESELAPVSNQLDVLELVFLIVFTIEISLKIMVLKQHYFRSWMNNFDIVIILLCFIVIILDIAESTATNYALYRFLRVLRFFRLVVMFHKASELKSHSERKVHKNYSVVSVTTPSETVLAILHKVLGYEWVSLNHSLRDELMWCVDLIKNRKLYEINIIADTAENNEIVKMGLNEEEFHDITETFNMISTASPIKTFDSSAHELLQRCNEWDFDILKLEKETMNSGLELISSYLFTVYDLYSLLEIPQQIFSSFIHEISAGYVRENPYHNSTHAADVVQAFYYLLSNCEGKMICCLHDIDVASCLISAAIHDFQHPGFNNLYMVNSLDNMAVRYNDKSVLENHHLAASFTVMQEDSKNIFKNFSKDGFKKIRGKIINLVLATDFSRHFSDISKFQTKLSEGVVEDDEARLLCMEMMMHASDISNPTRPWELCYIWADRVMQEFFYQGDRERELGLPISQLCDRNTVHIPKAQVGFMDLFVEPTFTALIIVMPKAEANLQILRQNKRQWNEKKGD